MKIMLVDDSKTTRNIQRNVLAQLGYKEIEEACDGQDALSKAASFKPELILLDSNMPNMDGLTFLKMFRGLGNRTPVLMVTTETERARVIEAIQAGVNDYIVKPFTPDVLKARIENVLSKTNAA